MYNNLIFYLLVLLVFTTYQPAVKPAVSWWSILGLILLPVLFWSLARTAFSRLSRRLEAGEPVAAGLSYHRLQIRFSILALILFTANVHFMGLKDLLLAVPALKFSTALTGLAGLAYFAVYLALLWSKAYQAHLQIYRSRLKRPRFVWSQIRFNLPVILPYLLLSAAADLIALLPQPGLKAWLETPAGEMTFVLTFMTGLVIFFPVLVRPLWGLTPLPDGPQRQAIESFCRRHGFAYREIMLWPLYEGEGLTAGVMGLVKRWRFILITRGLLNILDQEELEAVLAHELGHVKHRHLFFYFFFFAGYLVLAYAFLDLNLYLVLLSDWAMNLLLADQAGLSTTISLVMSGPVLILMIVYFRFLFGAYMRNFERQADLFALRLTGGIKGLVGSLEKIAFYAGQSRNVPSWHHFSVAQRVDFLVQCSNEPNLIRRHDRKVRLMVAAYGLAVVLTVFGGHLAWRNELGQRLNQRLVVGALEAEIKRRPYNVGALRILGDIYYQAGRLSEAASIYERAVRLNPRDPELLNNLAWTLLTKEHPRLTEKIQALELARAAAALKPAAHILDTLAEALYANGRVKEAVLVIEEALRRAGPADDRNHFLRQKAKFAKEAGNT
ncbi:MAG: M48 family metalloprotease [Thermodesulfobacteriota bacterium]